jgi:hypothetical protein
MCYSGDVHLAPQTAIWAGFGPRRLPVFPRFCFPRWPQRPQCQLLTEAKHGDKQDQANDVKSMASDHNCPPPTQRLPKLLRTRAWRGVCCGRKMRSGRANGSEQRRTCWREWPEGNPVCALAPGINVSPRLRTHHHGAPLSNIAPLMPALFSI